MATKITYEISIDELTMWVKDSSELSDKKVEKVVEQLKGIDFNNFISNEIEYWSNEIDAEPSDEEEEEEEESSDEEDNCAECCRCGEDVSNDEGEGKQVDGEYWCVDCVDDFAHRCELCNKFNQIQNIEYLPSKEDKEKKELLGNDYCIECYKKVEKFEFVENIV